MSQSKYSWIVHLLPDEQSFTPTTLTSQLLDKDHPEFDKVRKSIGHYPTTRIEGEPDEKRGFSGARWKAALANDPFHAPIQGIETIEQARALIVEAGSINRANLLAFMDKSAWVRSMPERTAQPVLGARTAERKGPPLWLAPAILFAVSLIASVLIWTPAKDNAAFLAGIDSFKPTFKLSGDLRGLHSKPW